MTNRQLKELQLSSPVWCRYRQTINKTKGKKTLKMKNNKIQSTRGEHVSKFLKSNQCQLVSVGFCQFWQTKPIRNGNWHRTSVRFNLVKLFGSHIWIKTYLKVIVLIVFVAYLFKVSNWFDYYLLYIHTHMCIYLYTFTCMFKHIYVCIFVYVYV